MNTEKEVTPQEWFNAFAKIKERDAEIVAFLKTQVPGETDLGKPSFDTITDVVANAFEEVQMLIDNVIRNGEYGILFNYVTVEYLKESKETVQVNFEAVHKLIRMGIQPIVEFYIDPYDDTGEMVVIVKYDMGGYIIV